MALIPINLTGGTYKHKSLPLSAQVTRNFWPQRQKIDSAKSPYVLESFWGQKAFSLEYSSYGGQDRGMFAHKGVLYKVTGDTLYSVDSDGVHTVLGTDAGLPGTARCIFTPIGDGFVISTEGTRYYWNGSSLTEITDSDLETGDAAAHLNNQIVYDGLGGRFCVSDVGDPTSINALNYASAESSADDLVRPFTHNQQVYMMGEETIEPWWNSGAGTPPFDRIEGGIIQVGLGALHSAANNDNYLYFFSDDRQVYRILGPGNSEIISTPPLAREFKSYETVSDAIGWCMTLNEQNFYVLTFPSENKTFVYPEGGEWFEWSSGSSGGRNRANSYAYAYGKHLVSDYSNGSIYELDEDTYTENDDPIVRLRDTGPIHGLAIGAPGKTLTMNSFELIMETGVGLLSGQGSDPVVMISFSDDGGHTFGTELWGTVGTISNKQWKVEWRALGSFESRIIRVRVSDPVHFCIYSAAAEIEVGI